MIGGSTNNTVVIKSKQSISLTRLIAFFALFYCCSINSYLALIPSLIRLILVLATPVLLCVFEIFVNLVYHHKIRKSIVLLSASCMILVILFWNNHTIHAEGIMGVYGQLMPLLCFLALFRKSDWYEDVINFLIFMGLFYAVWTYICLLFPGIYYDNVAPLMKSLYPQISYDINAKAGFTAHYSTNGMYLANGVLACISKLYFYKNKNAKRKNKRIVVFLILILGAFLICGKRGTLLCVILACYISYFFYNSNKKKGRIFKAIVVSFVLVVLVYIASLAIPAIANAYLRMIEMTSRGDVSTGRFDLWSAGWRDFLEKPVFGHGWRWFYYYDKSVFEFHDVHNCYVQFLAELGIIGSLPFFTFFSVSFVRAIKLLKKWRTNRLNKTIDSIGYNPLLFAVLYQTFFLIFIFEGTAFYNPEALVPYLLSCAMIDNCYYRTKEGDGNVCS